MFCLSVDTHIPQLFNYFATVNAKCDKKPEPLLTFSLERYEKENDTSVVSEIGFSLRQGATENHAIVRGI